MAIDSCEPQMIRAFEKQGWLVSNRQYMLRIGKRHLYADLRLRRSVAEIGVEEIIIVEVKCYNDPKRAGYN